MHLVYVSTVWNSYRKCRLHLLSCISNCSQRLAAVDPRNAFSPLSPYSQPQILAQARELAENAAASVPFHLLQDPGALLCLQEQTSAYKELGLIPNKAVGGLLLMYSILAIGECDIVPMELRDYFRDCLIWIGSVMGIGQAGVVADVSLVLSLFPGMCSLPTELGILEEVWILDHNLKKKLIFNTLATVTIPKRVHYRWSHARLGRYFDPIV